MTIHEETYRAFFGLDECDPIYSEISGEISSELHHIYPKGMGGCKTFDHDGKNYPIECIENYIAVTRKEHDKVSSNPKSYYWNIHQDTMSMHFI